MEEKYYYPVGISSSKDISRYDRMNAIKRLIEGEISYNPGCLNAYDMYVVDNYDTFMRLESELHKVFLKECFDLCNNASENSRLLDIDKFEKAIVTKSREEKYGFLGRKTRMVEYECEDDNPEFAPVKAILDKEPYIVIWFEGCCYEETRSGNTREESRVNSIIFTESCKFYQINYSFVEYYGNMKYQVYDKKIQQPYEIPWNNEYAVYNLLEKIYQHSHAPLEDVFPQLMHELD